jgi:translation elongation factor EF-4
VKIDSNDSTINIGKTGLKIKDVIGSAVSKIGAYKKLDNKKQVVALIDDVSGLFF